MTNPSDIPTDRATTITGLIDRFFDGERRNDTAGYADLLAADFRAVGPVGFVLTREQWLARFAPGDLVIRSMTWREAEVRLFGDAAIAIGVMEQQATYRDQPSNGRFRMTIIVAPEQVGGTPRIAGLQLSAIGQPFAAPGTDSRPAAADSEVTR